MCCFGRVEILILDFSASFLRYKFGGMRPAIASTPCHVRESRQMMSEYLAHYLIVLELLTKENYPQILLLDDHC